MAELDDHAAERELAAELGDEGYDLEAFAPPPIRFSIGPKDSDQRRTYEVHGDPPTEIVARMMRLERELRGLEPSSDRAMSTSLVEARDLVLQLVVEQMGSAADTARLRNIGVGQILTLFALLTGGPSVADAAARAITAGMATAAKTDDDLTDEERTAAAAGGQDGELGPLGSSGPS